MIIALDIDGVLLDIHSPWIDKYNKISGDNLRCQDITGWYVRDCVKPAYQNTVDSMRTPDLYYNVKPVKLASYGVTCLHRMGHRLVCATHDSLPYAKAKAHAIRLYFPVIRDIVLTSNDKSVVKYDLLIDDAAHNKPDILLSQPWNRYSDGSFIRAVDWQHVITIVRSMS